MMDPNTSSDNYLHILLWEVVDSTGRTQQRTALRLAVRGGQNSRTSEEEEEEEGFVPQANTADKIRVEGAQLETFRADPVLCLPHIPPYPLAVLSIPLLTSPSPSRFIFPPFSLSLGPFLFIFQTIWSCFWGWWWFRFERFSPSVWCLSSCSPPDCLSSAASQQDLSKVGSAFTM